MTDSAWHRPGDRLPADGQDCLLIAAGGAVGLRRERVFGPIAWQTATLENNFTAPGCWLDLWATPEAGTMIAVDQVGAWRAWGDIKPPEDMEY